MSRRMADLEAISAEPEVLTVEFDQLRLPSVCGGVFAHCLGKPMDMAHWRKFEGLNIQVDAGRQLRRVAENQARILALKAEVTRRLAPKGYWIGLEPWSDALWADARALAEAHFEEVDGGVEANRPFNLDQAFMLRLAEGGVLKVIVARRDGRLVGYYTWNVSFDVESQGLLIAQQGAWYVEPGHPRLAFRMFRKARAELKALGVKIIFPHHRTQGRGAGLGKFFKREGAKEIQHTYSLDITGD